MNLEVIIDNKFTESLVKIFTKKIDRETERIIKFIQNDITTIIGYIDNKIEIIEEENIERVFTEDKKIVLIANNKKYQTKIRLYEFENFLGNNFVRISQSEIVNIKFINKLDFSYKGNILLKFKNGDSTFVSRRSIKNFKNKLGI